MTPDQLKAARHKLGLTQAELAAKLQIPVNTIARWEQGKFKIEKGELLRLALEHLACGQFKENRGKHE